MKTILTLLLCLVAGLSFAQERPAYTIFDAQGRQVDYGRMIQDARMSSLSARSTIARSPIGWNTRSSRTCTASTVRT